jgi:hypothetical protein
LKKDSIKPPRHQSARGAPEKRRKGTMRARRRAPYALVVRASKTQTRKEGEEKTLAGDGKREKT